MQLFYSPEVVLPVHTLTAEESAHCVRVLRLVPGDTLHLTDGRGNLYTATVRDADPRRCTVEITSVQEEFEKRPYNLVMAVAPTKNIDRYEWFLEKATEVGTDVFIPLECRRSERRNLRHDRLLKVVTSAVKQSLKAYHPEVKEMTPFADAVRMDFDGVKLIAHCGEPRGVKSTLAQAVQKGDNVLIMIGPEGDFSPEEVDLALANGFSELTLGTSRLRTETAAIAAVIGVSMVNM